jgi:hypothetical protein
MHQEETLSDCIRPKSNIQQQTYAYTEGAAIRDNCVGIEDNILDRRGQRMGAIKRVEQMIRLANHCNQYGDAWLSSTYSARRFYDRACLQGEADVLAALPTKG